MNQIKEEIDNQWEITSDKSIVIQAQNRGDEVQVYEKDSSGRPISWKYRKKSVEKQTNDNQQQNTTPTKQIQQDLVNKGYFIGTSGPNKNGVDGVLGKKTKMALNASKTMGPTTYNNSYKETYSEEAAAIDKLFPTQSGGQVQGGPIKSVSAPQKAKVIKTIHPKNW